MVEGPKKVGGPSPIAYKGGQIRVISLRLKSIPRLGGSVSEIKGNLELEIGIKLIKNILANEIFEGSRFFSAAKVLEISGTIKGDADILRQLLNAGGKRIRICIVAPYNPTLWKGIAQRPRKMDESGIHFKIEKFIAEYPQYHLVLTSVDRTSSAADPFVIFEGFDLGRIFPNVLEEK